ncbi:MAG TPA: hypothetical protein VIY72_15555, partial [Acidimicrobiales bacterium]
IWDAATGTQVDSRDLAQGRLFAVALDPTGDIVLTMTDRGTVDIWHRTTDEVDRLQVPSSGLSSLAVDGDSFLLATQDGVRRVTPSAADRLLGDKAGGDEQGGDERESEWSLRVVDRAREPLGPESAGIELQVWRGDTVVASFDTDLSTQPAAVAITPDGSVVVAADQSGGLRFLRASDGETLGALTRRSPTLALATSPDGRFAAGVDLTGAVQFYDLERWRPLGQPLQAAAVPAPGSLDIGSVVGLAFSADGSVVDVSWPRTASSPTNTTWLAPNSWPAAACSLAGRSLTADERAAYRVGAAVACPG